MNNKKAILVVSFGTSHLDALEKTIGTLENGLRRAFTDYEVRRAFTSKIISDKLNNMGIKTDTVETALHKLVTEGFSEVICAATHIINGFEYDKLAQTADSFADKIKISVTRPLLSLTADYGGVIDALRDVFPTDRPCILMGHGTEHFSNSVYPALRYHLNIRGFKNIYVGTFEGFPSIEDVIKEIGNTSEKNVVLMPFMLVAGDHAKNDMAVEWKQRLNDAGFNAECVMKGLGEYENIRKLYIQRITEVL